MILREKIIALALLFGIVACNAGDNQKSPSSTSKILNIDKVMLIDLDGQAIDLKQYAGKTIFINFWATWCRPCIIEMPFIQEAEQVLRNEEVLFFMASAETEDEIKTFQNTNDYKFRYARIANLEELGIQALPTTLIFNSKGELTYSQQGVQKWNDKSHIELIQKIISAK